MTAARRFPVVQVTNTVFPDRSVAAAFFGGPDDGPFVMVNLLRFRPHAEYADGADAHLTGREAYDRYAVVVRSLIEELGGRVVYSGAVTGLLLGEVEDLWDAVGLVEYPSLAAFQRMITSPEMHAIEHHRVAGLAGQLNIRTKPQV
jgi:uncharacterized protein (DUF1330 family)